MTSQVSNAKTRREFLRLGTAGIAGLTLGGLAARPAWAAPKQIPIALQLYSVRHECAENDGKNLVKVLEAVAKMGYEGVEFAGYYGWNAKDLRKLLDDKGLQAVSTHTGLGELSDEKINATIELHQTIGASHVVVPSMPREYTKDLDGWREAADRFNELAEKLGEREMLVGYHNHSYEFKSVDGTSPWDVFMSATHADVIMQLDVGNCMGGGGDPVAILEKYAGRAKTIHMKEHGGDPQTVVGEGDAPWKKIIKLARSTAGTQWYIVEHERRGRPPLEAVDLCLKNLKKILSGTG
ncbi:MAG: TIM barrel protein [Planctomycetota bacterium]|jgi:sugar phosphate isomerase/epimerase